MRSTKPAVIRTPIASIVPGNAYPIAEIFAKVCSFLSSVATAVQARNVAIVTIITDPSAATVIVFCNADNILKKSVEL